MYCYVHPLRKTAAYCAEDIKPGLRNTPAVTFYRRRRELHIRDEEFRGIYVRSLRYRDMLLEGPETLLRVPKRGHLHHGLAMGSGVALGFGAQEMSFAIMLMRDGSKHRLTRAQLLDYVQSEYQ